MPRNPAAIKEELIEQVTSTLRRYGFETKYCDLVEDGCFDIAARRGSGVVLIKTLVNVDRYGYRQASDLRKITTTLSAVPLIIGVRTRRGEIEEGLVYERYGLKVISAQTLEMALKGEAPMICVKRGGIYVEIDGNRLREARLKMGLSLGELAELVGVSRKAIYEYERGGMRPTLDVALRLEEVLDEDIVEPLDIFKLSCEPTEFRNGNDEEEEVVIKTKTALEDLGLKAEAVKKAPFNIVAAKDSEKLRMVAEARKRVREIRYLRLDATKELAEVMKARMLVFVEQDKERIKDIDGVPVVSIRELRRRGLPEVLEEAEL